MKGWKLVSPGCVRGDLDKYNDLTLSECKTMCASRIGNCKAIEYEALYGGSTSTEGICRLKYASDYKDCDGATANTDVYIPENCDDYRK